MRANGIAPRTQRSTKDLVKEVTVLKSQLRKLSAAMEADAKEGVNGAVSAIELKSRAVIDEALEAAQNFIDEQTENAREMTDATLDKAAKMRDAAADSLDRDGAGTAVRHPRRRGRYRLHRGASLSPVVSR